MAIAIVEDDLVVGVAAGDIPGPEIPPSVPISRLRVIGGALVDIASRTSWFVDEHGRKRTDDAPGRQAVSCAWDAKIVRVGDQWRAQTDAERRAPPIKSECERRIHAVLSPNTQMNLAAYSSELALRETLGSKERADVAVMRSARLWVQAMLSASRSAIESGSVPVWPELPADVAALAARF